MALVVGLIGGMVLLSTVSGTVRTIGRDRDYVGSIFIFFWMMGIGGLLVAVAYRAWGRLDQGRVRGVIATVAVIAWISAVVYITPTIHPYLRLPEDAVRAVISLIVIPLVLMSYEWLSRRLIVGAGVRASAIKPMPKFLIGAACLVIWLDITTILETVGLGPGSVRPMWSSVSVFAPILLCVGLYRVIVHYAYDLPGLPFIGPWWHAKGEAKQSKRHRQRAACGLCPGCEYDIRQTLADRITRCPECGFDLSRMRFGPHSPKHP